MNQMTICLIIFILTLLAYAFLSSRVSMAVISLISVAALMVTGCMDPNDALSCFANSSAILMASMFVVSAGLNRTQMVKKISAFICRISKAALYQGSGGLRDSDLYFGAVYPQLSGLLQRGISAGLRCL